MQQLSEQEILRRQEKETLEKMGINPYPSETYEVSHHTATIKEQFEEGVEEFKQVSLAGRLMSRRIMGSASFAELQDASGRIQIYFRFLYPKVFDSIE